jgi:hypothetical protein
MHSVYMQGRSGDSPFKVAVKKPAAGLRPLFIDRNTVDVVARRT